MSATCCDCGRKLSWWARLWGDAFCVWHEPAWDEAPS